jgi:hypothetical protein
VIVKARLLLTSALFVFVQIPAPHAQETLDLAKITCEELAGEKLAAPSRDVVLWLSGYYNGKRNNTIIEAGAMDEREDKVESYCNQHREMSVMDAVNNVLGLDK